MKSICQVTRRWPALQTLEVFLCLCDYIGKSSPLSHPHQMGSSQARAVLLFCYLFDIHFGWLESRAEGNLGDKMV